MSVFTFAKIECRHHFVYVVAALFPIENSVNGTINGELIRNEKSAASIVIQLEGDSPKTNSLIFMVNFLIERPFSHQQLVWLDVINRFTPEILVAMVDVIVGHLNPLISSRYTIIETYSTLVCLMRLRSMGKILWQLAATFVDDPHRHHAAVARVRFAREELLFSSNIGSRRMVGHRFV